MAGTPTLATTAGAPLLLEGYQPVEKLAHQSHERIPERVIHTKGRGALGTFTVTHAITKYTCAKLFSKIGEKTEVLSRWSTVAGESVAADTEREARGFSLKF